VQKAAEFNPVDLEEGQLHSRALAKLLQASTPAAGWQVNGLGRAGISRSPPSAAGRIRGLKMQEEEDKIEMATFAMG